MLERGACLEGVHRRLIRCYSRQGHPTWRCASTRPALRRCEPSWVSTRRPPPTARSRTG